MHQISGPQFVAPTAISIMYPWHDVRIPAKVEDHYDRLAATML